MSILFESQSLKYLFLLRVTSVSVYWSLLFYLVILEIVYLETDSCCRRFYSTLFALVGSLKLYLLFTLLRTHWGFH